jgi:hypothetical protein
VIQGFACWLWGLVSEDNARQRLVNDAIRCQSLLMRCHITHAGAPAYSPMRGDYSSAGSMISGLGDAPGEYWGGIRLSPRNNSVLPLLLNYYYYYY